jgi:heme exporter protein B
VTRFVSQLLAIAGKDLRLELRSRERLVSMLVFAVLVAVVFSFALDPAVRAGTVAGAMLWVMVLFTGMLGLGRSFAIEREQEAMTGILLAPVDRGAIFLGKFLSNLVLLSVVELVAFPIFALFFRLAMGRVAGGLALVVLLATIGFMALGTLFSAMAAGTRMGETLLPVLLLPLLVPVVIFAAGATQRLLAGRPMTEIAGNLKMLLAFDVVFLVVCTLAFGAVMEE